MIGHGACSPGFPRSREHRRRHDATSRVSDAIVKAAARRPPRTHPQRLPFRKGSEWRFSPAHRHSAFPTGWPIADEHDQRMLS